MQPPPQSPDLNPIKNLWDYLDRRIRITPIKSKDELKLRLTEEWSRIPLEYLNEIISSMPTRLNHALKQKGNPTKY